MIRLNNYSLLPELYCCCLSVEVTSGFSYGKVDESWPKYHLILCGNY